MQSATGENSLRFTNLLYTVLFLSFAGVCWADRPDDKYSDKNLALVIKTTQISGEDINDIGATFRVVNEQYFYIDAAAFLTHSNDNSSLMEDNIHVDSYMGVISAVKYDISDLSVSLGALIGLGLGNVREADGDTIGECLRPEFVRTIPADRLQARGID